MKKMISVVIPAYNEEDNIEDLYTRFSRVFASMPAYEFEVIIVNNGSVDSTREKLIRIHMKDSRFKIISLTRNFLPVNNAIVAGLRYARGDAVFITYADLQDPPELIPEFVKKWEEGFEIVYGIIRKRDNIRLSRKVLYAIFYSIINKLTDNVIPKDASDFTLFDKKVNSIINRLEEKNKFLRGLIPWTGFNKTGIEYDRAPRMAGESKADLSTVLNFAVNGLFSFSNFPLYIASVLGFVLAVLAFIMLIVEGSLFLLYGREIPGVATIILLMLLSFGILFFLLGIIGGYIGKIYEEVKKRPDFIISEEIGFDAVGR
jgi:polyisoprenyl-phosphate glycosyltransferase